MMINNGDLILYRKFNIFPSKTLNLKYSNYKFVLIFVHKNSIQSAIYLAIS